MYIVYGPMCYVILSILYHFVIPYIAIYICYHLLFAYYPFIVYTYIHQLYILYTYFIHYAYTFIYFYIFSLNQLKYTSVFTYNRYYILHPTISNAYRLIFLAYFAIYLYYIRPICIYFLKGWGGVIVGTREIPL